MRWSEKVLLLAFPGLLLSLIRALEAFIHLGSFSLLHIILVISPVWLRLAEISLFLAVEVFYVMHGVQRVWDLVLYYIASHIAQYFLMLSIYLSFTFFTHMDLTSLLLLKFHFLPSLECFSFFPNNNHSWQISSWTPFSNRFAPS